MFFACWVARCYANKRAVSLNQRHLQHERNFWKCFSSKGEVSRSLRLWTRGHEAFSFDSRKTFVIHVIGSPCVAFISFLGFYSSKEAHVHENDVKLHLGGVGDHQLTGKRVPVWALEAMRVTQGATGLHEDKWLEHLPLHRWWPAMSWKAFW